MTAWRFDNAKLMRGATFHFKKYTRWSETWEHEHWVGCWAKFMEERVSPDVLTEGFVTDADKWVCAECFRDLRDAMEWKLAT
jgi:hypothetical protein